MAKILKFVSAAERQRMREGMKKWGAFMRRSHENHQRKLKELAELERRKSAERA
jgi:hypothetical protein